MKLFIAALLFCAVSCETKPKVDARIYQPSVLILEKGTSVQTSEGVYIFNGPAEFEIWHSGKTVEELERKLSRL